MPSYLEPDRAERDDILPDGNRPIEDAGLDHSTLVSQSASADQPLDEETVVAETAPDELRRACHLLFAPGQVVELRALEVRTSHYGAPHTVSGYFDDTEALVQAVLQLATDAKNIYVTLTP